MLRRRIEITRVSGHVPYLTELQKSSERHAHMIAELHGAVTGLKKMVEQEIEA